MDKIININGIEYIQKAEYDRAKQDADNIRQLVSSSIADLSGLLSNQVVAQSSNQVFSERSKELPIRLAGARPYHIIRMEKDGTFYSKPNRKMIFTVKDVLKIDKVYNKHTTKKDIKKMSKDFNIPIDTVYRIVYNLDKGTFSEYIKEFLSDVNTKIERKTPPIQNNPEKRKESVLFSS